mmetsp:Transcript_52818/g.139033  ORF Transcript_52818/g.139033 Transcript_52818/m.139033 type:complete len:270 (-) Transcript_52818:221-1030(-)
MAPKYFQNAGLIELKCDRSLLSILSAQDALHSLLEPLVRFLSGSESEEELNQRLGQLWSQTDCNHDGMVSFQELCFELRRYNMAFTLGEWNEMLRAAHMEPGLGLNEVDPADFDALAGIQLTRSQFFLLFKHYLRVHYQLELGFAGKNCGDGEIAEKYALGSLKLILLTQAYQTEPMRQSTHMIHPSSADCCNVSQEASCSPREMNAAQLRCLVLERQAMICWGGPPPCEGEQRAQIKAAEEYLLRLRAQVESALQPQANSASPNCKDM